MVLFYKSNLNNIPYQPLTDKCIVLDLDETLVHSSENIQDLNILEIYKNPTFLNLRKRIYTLQLDDVTNKNGEGLKYEMWGITRPYIKEFLTMCFTYFKIVAVWSAGRRKYVEAIVDYLFKDIRRPHVIFTYDHCEQYNVGKEHLLVKPLQKMINTVPGLNKYMSLENTFVIDDRASTFTYVNQNNGILIPAYIPRPDIYSLSNDDTSLRQLMSWFLRSDVINSLDVRFLFKNSIFRI